MSAAQRSSLTRTMTSRSLRLQDTPAPAATSTPAAADYAQQLHAAILATRETILTEQAAAAADRNTALGGLDVSRQTFADARHSLSDANAALAVTTFLDRKLGDANLTATNLVALAQHSDTEAIGTTAAMADAATSIKAAAVALDQVIMDANGVAGITKNNDKDRPIDNAAQAAVVAAAKVGQSVEELKRLALCANIQAARPSTAAPVQAGQANQTSVSALLTSLDATVKSTTEALTKAQAARTTDLTALFHHSQAFTVASRDDAALIHSVRVIDQISNFSLAASIHNLPEGEEPQNKAGLRATWDDAIAKTNVSITCFAVPSAYVPSFDFAAAVAAETKKYGTVVVFYKAGGKPAEGARPPHHADLSVDSNGEIIDFGRSYSLFALLTPLPEHGPRNATHFSFPTPSITATVQLGFAKEPQVYKLPGGAFVALFTNATPTKSVAAYRLFFSPTETLTRLHGDELKIADALNAAGYVEIIPRQVRFVAPSTHALAQSIWEKLTGEIPETKLGPTANEPAGLERWLKPSEKQLASTYVVLFSPFAKEEGDTRKGFNLGRYSDMYGDLFDLDHRTYRGFVLAVGVSEAGVRQAANVLSKPTEVFFGAPPPEPLPAASADRKPAQK